MKKENRNEINLKKQKLIVTILTIALIIIDLGTKFIASKQGKIIIPQGDYRANNLYYNFLSIIIISLIVRFMSSSNSFVKLSTKIVLSFGLAGAFGNFLDRVLNRLVLIWHIFILLLHG